MFLLARNVLLLCHIATEYSGRVRTRPYRQLDIALV